MRVGIDIVESKRFEKIKDSHLEKIFHSDEIAYALYALGVPMRLAGMYAAKEAFLKAIGCGLHHGINLSEIIVCHDKLGKPYLQVSDQVKKEYHISSIDVSISHTDSTSVAICILNE